jgi:hypothetical protein
MSEESIVMNMVKYIEKKEQELQAAKMLNDNKAKANVIQSIINKLEREIEETDNEDQ